MIRAGVLGGLALGLCAARAEHQKAAAATVLRIDMPMAAPRWAQLERQLLERSAAACREFFDACFDARGYFKGFIRWGANDGPDDAFENFNHWPELHALGASDEVLDLYLRGWEGLLRQYAEAKTVAVPAGREGMYYREFSAQSDWMHHGEGLQLFNRMGLSIPTDANYQARARRYAGFYMGQDPEAPNYDPERRLIRSLINGSKGPMLREASALDWAGDPFDVTGFRALHGARSLTVVLGAGCGSRLEFTLERYANPPTVLHPWHAPAE